METILPENAAVLEDRYRKVWKLIIAKFTAIFILAAAPYILAPNTENKISGEILNTLWILIIFVAVGTFMLRRFFYRWDRLRDIALLKGIKGVLRTLEFNAIILASLADLVLLVGMIIGYLSGDWFNALRAGIIAVILLAINFPRQSVWEKIVGNLQEV